MLKWKGWPIALLVIVYCCVGLVAVRYHSMLSMFERDGTEFLFDAQRILQGKGYDSDFWPFGYMATVALVSLLPAIGFFTAGKLVSFFSAIGVLLLVYRLGKETFSERVGRLGALLLATNALFFRHTILVETDMLFTFLLLSCIFLISRGNQWQHYLHAGLVAGLAYMVKYGAYAVFPAAFFLGLYHSRPSLVHK
jgi:Gpi18-like mannosyltransferase